MINKKKIFVLLIFCLLGACTSPTTMLGPAYTLSTSGNVFQTSLSYGSNELVKTYSIFEKQDLKDAVMRINKRLGPQRTKIAIDSINKKDWETV